MSDFLRNVTLRGAGRFSGSRVRPAPVPSILLGTFAPLHDEVAPPAATPERSLVGRHAHNERPDVETVVPDVETVVPDVETVVPEIQSGLSEVIPEDREPPSAERERLQPRRPARVRTKPKSPSRAQEPDPSGETSGNDAAPRSAVSRSEAGEEASGGVAVARRSEPGVREAQPPTIARREVDEPGAEAASPSARAEHVPTSPRVTPADTSSTSSPTTKLAPGALDREARSLPPDEPTGEATRSTRVTTPEDSLAPSEPVTAETVTSPSEAPPAAVLRGEPVHSDEHVSEHREARPGVANEVERITAAAEQRPHEEPGEAPPGERAHLAQPRPEEPPEQAPATVDAPVEAGRDPRRDEPRSPASGEPASEEPRPIEIRIGTVEVSSAPPPSPPTRPAPATLKGFDDHVYVRNYIQDVRI